MTLTRRPPPGYRFLKVGEVVRPEDKQYQGRKGRWVFKGWGGVVVEERFYGLFARKLPTPKPSNWRSIDDDFCPSGETVNAPA